MKQFKIRSSAISEIMASPKKPRIISAGAETYCQKFLKEQLYGMRIEHSNKYTERGHSFEDQSIELLSTYLNQPLEKNEQWLEGDYITGTPDLITPDRVIDIKTSWSFETFPLFEEVIPSKSYMYQIQAYMHLTGLRKGSVCYMLLDNPEIEHYYDGIGQALRMKRFDFEYDESIIERVHSKVADCRNYIHELLNADLLEAMRKEEEKDLGF